MRFSLRTLLVVFVIVGLALATMVSTWRLQQAEREIERIRNAYGAGGPNRYRMNLVGEFGPYFSKRSNFQIIRLDEPAEYRLALNFYDGATRQGRQETVPLTEEDHEIAIWQSATQPNQQINIHSLKSLNRVFKYSLHLQRNTALFRYPNSTLDGTIDDGPFLIYAFCPANSHDPPNFQWIDRDEGKLHAWCDKFKTQCVEFKFERLVK